MGKFVYSFNEGSKDMRNILGGKGANLAEMTVIGLPVPFGFTVTTEACRKYYDEDCIVDDEIRGQIFEKLSELEHVTDKCFGDASNPLLISVRSGSVISMPGMMDTILNLGLNDETVEGLAVLTGSKRFAYDSYRRFIQMFGDVVLEIEPEKFDSIFEAKKTEKNCRFDVELKEDDLLEIINGYKQLVKRETGKEFIQNPEEQLLEAVKAVFRSWNNERAILYRKINDIPDTLGTAVNIQSMVFGNMGESSGTGVAFTRNPIDGEKGIFGEFLVNAQGEDVVAGIRTPHPISAMKVIFPEVYGNFVKIAELLEKHFTDMQDIEFTIEKNKLYILQCRTGKRTAKAAVKIAVDMESEKLIDKKAAVMRIEPGQIAQLLHPEFAEEELKNAQLLTKGLAASPGAASGKIYFTAEAALEAVNNGEKVILVRQETSPEDLAGMVAAQGILTARGGMTSHAAVVARGMGRCCVSGCDSLKIDYAKRQLRVGDTLLNEGESISLDGTEGCVYLGNIKTQVPALSENFTTIMKWADDIRDLKVRTNADSPSDARIALEFGAEGIGLCRTEHMFFEKSRIGAVRRLILAGNVEERKQALAEIMPFQKGDFKEIYEVMGESPVTIRLLDPPLHEFLPSEDSDIHDLAEKMNVSYDVLKTKIEALKELNPMLGHRGCRLAVTYPEIAAMQTEAIITAALEVKQEKDMDVTPEIMVPLVSMAKEFEFVKKVVTETAERCIKAAGAEMKYFVGTMIETPRAALVADEIAKEAEFFSFGTNDLTQMTFGFSRDDSAKYIREYKELKILESDPFHSLDQNGVGVLVRMAAEKGKTARSNIKLGLCGEQGGEPETIDFCHRIGLNYVSCSPYKVPVARLAAAQASIRNEVSLEE